MGARSPAFGYEGNRLARRNGGFAVGGAKFLGECFGFMTDEHVIFGIQDLERIDVRDEWAAVKTDPAEYLASLGSNRDNRVLMHAVCHDVESIDPNCGNAQRQGKTPCSGHANAEPREVARADPDSDCLDLVPINPSVRQQLLDQGEQLVGSAAQNRLLTM